MRYDNKTCFVYIKCISYLDIRYYQLYQWDYFSLNFIDKYTFAEINTPICLRDEMLSDSQSPSPKIAIAFDKRHKKTLKFYPCFPIKIINNM